jgi:hypothetical protein
MNKTTLVIQDYGSSILIFIKGVTLRDAYDKWLSLANWGATSLLDGGNPPSPAKNTVSCWSTVERFQRYLYQMHFDRLTKLNDKNVRVQREAYRAAKAEFEGIATESYRSVNSNAEFYEFGVITAEKPDDDFQDACYKLAFAN